MKGNRKRSDSSKLPWWKWKRWKGSPIAWLILAVVGIFLSITIHDFVVNPLSDILQEDDINIIVVSTINLEDDKNYFIEGKFRALWDTEDMKYYRTMEEVGRYSYDVLLPPFSSQVNESFYVDMFTFYWEEEKVSQSIYIYCTDSKLEDFRCSIHYGYSVLEVDGEGSEAFFENCVIIEKDEILPGGYESLSDKNLPVTFVTLNTSNFINISKIIEKIQIKHYTQGVFYGYWHEIPSDNLIHYGCFVTDSSTPEVIFDKLLRRCREIPKE